MRTRTKTGRWGPLLSSTCDATCCASIVPVLASQTLRVTLLRCRAHAFPLLWCRRVSESRQEGTCPVTVIERRSSGFQQGKDWAVFPLEGFRGPSLGWYSTLSEGSQERGVYLTVMAVLRQPDIQQESR